MQHVCHQHFIGHFVGHFIDSFVGRLVSNFFSRFAKRLVGRFFILKLNILRATMLCQISFNKFFVYQERSEVFIEASENRFITILTKYFFKFQIFLDDRLSLSHKHMFISKYKKRTPFFGKNAPPFRGLEIKEEEKILPFQIKLSSRPLKIANTNKKSAHLTVLVQNYSIKYSIFSKKRSLRSQFSVTLLFSCMVS